MSKEILISKRDGRKEPLELDKLHKVVFHACADITGVSESEVDTYQKCRRFNHRRNP